MIVLQKIIMPVDQSEILLFYRNKNSTNNFETGKKIKKYEYIDFNTYYNAFSLGKWKKYTSINDINVQITFEGEFTLIINHATQKNGKTITKIVKTTKIFSYTKRSIRVMLPQDIVDGMVSICINCDRNNSILYDAAFVSCDYANIRDVTIGLGICTYNRESYVKRNIENIEKEVFLGDYSDMRNNIYVFISNNGKSGIFENERKWLKIYKNKNVGGSGGFARCLIEMHKHNRGTKKKITHAILMDDDIYFSCESLFRTYNILRLLKPYYYEAFIGGAMLSADEQYIQIESGAIWTASGIISRKKQYDLRHINKCLDNEIEETSNYNAWWFCCIPLNNKIINNLPMPFFIKFDDIEYGLRKMNNLILLNGICVWHERFEKKYADWLEYYNVRNELICSALYLDNSECQKVLNRICIKMIRNLLKCKYESINATLTAIKDFFKGPKWLETQDGEKLHNLIVNGDYWKSRDRNILFKATDSCQKNFGIINNIDIALIYIGDMIRQRYVFSKNIKNICEEYRREKEYLSSIVFWQNYLDI